MVEEVRKDNIPRQGDSDDHSDGAAAGMTKPVSSKRYSLRQDSFTVPMPTYYKHVDEGAELGHAEEPESEEWRHAAENDHESDEAISSRRKRRIRFRWWGILVLILLYAAFKMVRFDTGP